MTNVTQAAIGGRRAPRQRVLLTPRREAAVRSVHVLEGEECGGARQVEDALDLTRPLAQAQAQVLVAVLARELIGSEQRAQSAAVHEFQAAEINH